MGKMIGIDPLFSTGYMSKYRFKGKTYIVWSSFMIPDTDIAVSKHCDSHRMRNIFGHILIRDLLLTGSATADTINPSVDSLSARKEQ